MNFNYVSLGNKIKTKRESLLLSSFEVAEKVGVTESSYLQIENGTSDNVSGDLIVRISLCLNVDFRFLISPDYLTAENEVNELFRINNSLTKSDRASIQNFIRLCEYKSEIEELLGKTKPNPGDYSTYRFPNRRHDLQGKECAKIERQRLGIIGPIDNPYNLLRSQKIHIFRKQLEERNISGLYIKHPRAGDCILINYLDDIYRQNFSLMHEYGHVLFDSKEKQSVSYINKNNYIETRANNFSSYFLLPEDQMMIFTKNSSLDTTKAKISAVCNHYKINRHVVIYRLLKMKYITEQTKDFLLKDRDLKAKTHVKIDPELSNCSANNRDFYELLIKQGLSIEYLELCRCAYDQGEISFSKVVEAFNCDMKTALKILNTWNVSYGGNI